MRGERSLRTRVLVAAFVVVALVVAGASRSGLEALEERRVPAELLYLPEGPYLRALALGQEETLADLIYIWAIQYYSNYEDAELRFDYLEKVFGGAIAELDPRFVEAYLVGALVMSLEARDPKMALRLYDKGLERNPESWELAYWAGWECYMAQRFECARDYWYRARDMPGAPPELLRLAAASLAKAGDIDAAIAEYRAIVDDPPDERSKDVARAWIDRLQLEKVLKTTQQAIDIYTAREGRCPRTLRDLVDADILNGVPRDAQGREFRYEPSACRVFPSSGTSFGDGA